MSWQVEADERSQNKKDTGEEGVKSASFRSEKTAPRVSGDCDRVDVLGGIVKTGHFSFERRVAFIDAAAAIALTLLVLPLLDATTDIETNTTATEWFNQHAKEVFAFLAGFGIVSLSWRQQEETMILVDQYSFILSFLHLTWLLSITFLPVSSKLAVSLSYADNGDRIEYILNLALSRLIVFLMLLEVRRSKHLWKNPDHGPELADVLEGIIDLSMYAVAFGLAYTPVGFYGLFLLITTPILLHLLKRRWPEKMKS